MSSPMANVEAFDVHAPQSRAQAPNGLIVTASKVFAAIREGLACMHEYEKLRAKGLSHADAAEKIMRVQ